MTKIKRILAFVSTVMMLFTVTLAFAGCKDEEEEKITYRVYLSYQWLTRLDSITEAENMEGVTLLCELKDGDNKEVTISYEEETYIYVRYISPKYENVLLSCSGRRKYFVEYSSIDDKTQEITSETLKRGIYRYRFVDDSAEDPLDRFSAWLKLIVK